MKLKTLLTTLLITTSSTVWSTNPWHKDNLYDTSNDSFFIPVELWTGGEWDGQKHLNINPIDKTFMGNKIITGPLKWHHPYLDKDIVVYKRVNKSKVQLFKVYSNAIARVYDSRKNRYFDLGAKFPVGSDWKIDKTKSFEQFQWKKGRKGVRDLSIRINSITFNSDSILKKIDYTFYVNQKPDHRYEYRPNIGMTNLEKL
ncbi:MAG: hypothetical protein NZ824_09915 [Candidatus Thioglobus sp.]|nr:hypothetical protein [Candidatus Thioglobus sp.]